jgi:hypothetical protein
MSDLRRRRGMARRYGEDQGVGKGLGRMNVRAKGARDG